MTAATSRRLFDRRVDITIDTINFQSLDCEFEIEKTLKPEPNTCNLTVYNLTREHQGQLEQLQQFTTGKRSKKGFKERQTQATKGIPCRIEAGYASGISQQWLGDLRTVETTREGADWVTKLSSGDGEKSWQNARLHVSYGPKTGIDTALRAIARGLNIGEGNLSKVVAQLKMAGSAIYPTGAVISGSASRQLTDFARSADLEVSVQDGALQFIDRGKALAGTAIRLAPETGLIGSPTVDNQGLLTATMLMIPDVRVGGLVTVDAARIKGTYRIEKAVWSGQLPGEDWSIKLQGKRY